MPSSAKPSKAQVSVRTLLEAFDADHEGLQEEFFEFLRLQSVSSEPGYRAQVRACADWVSDFLEDAGLKVELWETSGYPVIFATWLEAGPDKPTVLIYNHYDVQPVDPIELWHSDPFEPTIRDGEVYARGAEDNKGQCFYVMSAIRELLRRDGKLPVNVKICIEGEEETGSTGLAGILEKHRSELAADYLFVVDLGIHAPESPALTLGVRGIATMSVEMVGSSSDLHSGTHGGIVYNPNRAMVELLAKLYDDEGRITVPGFYAEVANPTSDELAQLDFHFDEAEYEAMFGAKAVGGETQYSALQSAWIRPTLEINGIGGGYTGEGFKTVIPARTIAKLSVRLVPNQDPMKIAAAVEKFLKANTPAGMELRVEINPGVGKAVRSSPNSKAVVAAAAVYSAVFEKPCQFILSGGSIPIVPGLAEAADAEVVMMGYGLPDDNIHAPNEHFGMDRVRRGFATMGAILEQLAE